MTLTHYILNSFVYVKCLENEALLYNTINNKQMTIQKSNFLNYLKTKTFERNRIIIINGIEIQNTENERILKYLESDYFIQKIDVENKIYPICWKPIINIQEDPNKITNTKGYFDGVGILKYLSELTIYINDYNNKPNPKYINTHQQFIFPLQNQTSIELSLNSIERIIKENSAFITKINIVGGDIYKYSRFNDLLTFLESQEIEVVYYTQLENLSDENYFGINPAIIITNSSNKELIRHIHRAYSSSTFIFIIESEDDYQFFLNIVVDCKIDDYVFKPFLNQNYNFFKSNVYIETTEIFENSISMREIYKNQSLNQLFFGHLFIMPNGNVYSQPIKNKCIGNISDISLAEIIYKEIKDNKDWFIVRSNFNICSDCLYMDFCPPISTYEILLNQPLCSKYNNMIMNDINKIKCP